MLFKDKYTPVGKNCCSSILNCSSKTRKPINVSTSDIKKNFFQEHLQAAASGFAKVTSCLANQDHLLKRVSQTILPTANI